MNEVHDGRGVRDDVLLVPRRDFLILGSAAAVGAVATTGLAKPAQAPATSALSLGFVEGTLDEIRGDAAPRALTSASRLGSANHLGASARLRVHGIVRAEGARAEAIDLDVLYPLPEQVVPVHAWSGRDAKIGNSSATKCLVPVSSSAPLTVALDAKITPAWTAAVAHRFFGAKAPVTAVKATAALRRNGLYFIAVPAAGQAEPNWESVRVVAPADGTLPKLEQATLLGSKPVSFDYIVVAAERA